MKEQMTAEEYREFIKNKSSKNKYNAKKTMYEGVLYDSRKEAFYAAKLDLRIKAGEIQSWERQYPIELEAYGAKSCTYRIDFKVILSDGSIEYHEVKGKETALWKVKWKMTQAYMEKHEPEATLVLIK
ncbi:DUF1064 domain-containing protein [Bernardetia sp.]|uniref:DUF1064 domain-containing protein n=1 Tax=Bernardetia sp. TaxID=1937974 RepID=UPI0025BF0C20|nr:DUF1064 domain-containing protein [Bernardetia sp.]